MPDSVRESLSKMIDDALRLRKEEAFKDYPPRPPTWAPTDVDVTLEAQVIDTFETQYGVRRVVVDLEGNQWVLPSSSIVVKELLKAKAGIGDVVWLKFLGTKKTKDGTKTYKNYQMVIIPKDAFERTGQKFPTPKPVPPKSNSQVVPAPQGLPVSPSQSAPQPQPQTGVDMAKVEEVVKRLADMAGKVGGLRKEEFEKMVKNMTGTTLTADETALMFSGHIKIDEVSGKVLKA